MTDFTADEYRAAAKRAYAAGDVKSANELIQRGMAVEASSQHEMSAEKGVMATIYDNVVGYGAIDTPGERFGATIRDAVNSAESGARSTIAGLLDLPGKALTGLGGAAVNAMGDNLPAGVAEGARTAFAQTPLGDGNVAASMLGADGSLDYQPQTNVGRYSKTVGEFLPFAGANPMAYAVAPGIASEFVGQKTEGVNFPESWPLVGGSAVEPWARTGAALAAPAAYNLGIRAITPNPADPARIAAADRLKSEGIDSTAGQATGNRRLAFREEQSARTGDIIANQDGQFTEAALRRIEARDPVSLQPAKRATPEVLKQASDDIGQMFSEVAPQLKIRADAGLVSTLDDVAKNYEQLTAKSNIAPVIRTTFGKVKDALSKGVEISGAEYKQWRSQLSKATVGNDAQLKEAAKSYISALDAAVERSGVPREVVEKFAKARSYWRDFLAIEDAASKAGAETAVGIINPRQIRSAVTTGGGKSSYATGSRDLGNLARDANAVIGPLPSSGTAERGLASQMFPGAGASGVAGGLAYGLTKDPQVASYAAMGGLLAPAIANRSLGSPLVQKYLQNQLVTQQPRVLSGGIALTSLLNSLKN